MYVLFADLLGRSGLLTWYDLLAQVPKLEALNTSLASFHSALMAKDSPVPDEKLVESKGSWVDVRDVAAIHVEALLQEKAGGERFCAASST